MARMQSPTVVPAKGPPAKALAAHVSVVRKQAAVPDVLKHLFVIGDRAMDKKEDVQTIMLKLVMPTDYTPPKVERADGDTARIGSCSCSARAGAGGGGGCLCGSGVGGGGG
jgi:hypothetical protein